MSRKIARIRKELETIEKRLDVYQLQQLDGIPLTNQQMIEIGLLDWKLDVLLERYRKIAYRNNKPRYSRLTFA